jgi:hypothetical protein
MVVRTSSCINYSTIQYYTAEALTGQPPAMPSQKSKSGRQFRPPALALNDASDYNLPSVLKYRFERMIRPRVRRSGIPMNAAIYLSKLIGAIECTGTS